MRPNGSAIRAIRQARKVGLRGLAQQTGRDRSHLSRIERGEAGASDDTIQRIASALEVPLKAIIHKEAT
ncbi:hypothetical protein GCM10020000_07300 [Streptomyces olivoverticillatus]|uniref:helix-turn-helix domain-containing protein n=1 Tax=Streptomyces olivoverticillatus TaxID=66427 RepID=UPI0016172533